jgi:hypothetical protein
VKGEELFFALNESTQALHFAKTAANRFTYISNQLTEAQISLSAAESEIGKLIQKSSG